MAFMSLNGIDVSYDKKKQILKGLNLEVEEGELVSLLGPSGCGKSTTLRVVAGFIDPQGGTFTLDGEDMTKVPVHKRQFGLVFQSYALFPHLSVYDNVAFGLRTRKMDKDVIDKKVREILEVCGLTELADRFPKQMSGGQRQRVALARALVIEPKLLLLDEPLSNLDAKLRLSMRVEIKRLQKRLGITTLFVTHDQEEALTMSDTIIVMSDGCIQQIGTPEDIYNEPKNAFVADFIGESNIFTGVMPADNLVRFCGKAFPCEDGGFEKDEPVDAVVRPEDVKLVPPAEGQLKGKVTSVIFKGIHYQILVQCGRYEIEARSTAAPAVGANVGLKIEPDGIHVMKKVFRVNRFSGVITKKNTVEFGDGEFECDVTQLYKGSHLDEEGYLITAKGEKLDLTGTEVNVEVSLHDITMSDDPEEGGACGHIISLIYKSEYYRYIVRTENEEDYVLACEDLWNENDFVSLVIPKDKIRLTLKTAEEKL